VAIIKNSRSLTSGAAFGPAGTKTYRDFLHAIASCAESLPATRYAINICASRYAFSVGFFAALLRGQTNILLPSAAESIRASAEREFTDSCCIDDRWIATAAPVVADTVSVLQKLDSIPPEHVAALVFSSGTTGLQKQISKSWVSLLTGATINRGCLAAAGIGGGPMVATVPPWHMYGLEWSVLMPLVADVSVFAGTTLFPEDIRNGLEQSPEPAILLSTPLHLRALLDAKTRLPDIRLVLSATAPLAADIAARIETEWGCSVLEIYGCSEVGSMAYRSPNEDQGWHFFPELQVEQIDQSASVRVSYAHSGESTTLADKLDFRTDGSFLITGRDDDLVKVAGKRGSLADITRALVSIEGVADAVIYEPARLGLQGTGRLAAIVYAPQLAASDVRTALRELLDPAFVPRPIHMVDSIPRNATGKLTQAALIAMIESMTVPDVSSTSGGSRDN
jgi:acyl-coenzyme A synthetase/AMP-(fatty) acid ligase